MTLSLLLALSPAAVTEIPKNFLLTEPAARKKMDPEMAYEQGYEISDKLTRPLELNPCGHRRAADRGRVAARTITLWTSAPSGSAEQLIVYRSPRAAHAALGRLRAEVKRCARTGDPDSPQLKIEWRTSKVKVGDESVGMGYRTWQDGSVNQTITGVVARRGSALMIYTTTEGDYDPGRLTKDARKMAAKVCRLPGVCRP
ncbi:sensor domain-containing protein [Nonomuraea sp. NN258]|uniref:sensor domain-containing protein n=1 Tax=Nonomuraea antri TaxID=2730852 RepID=UPI001568A115|nr:sensor domain-containing protein [Nonomuraea antri]NRQ32548.1 sensor domain-containing protein [Nonomuraea antri]